MELIKKILIINKRNLTAASKRREDCGDQLVLLIEYLLTRFIAIYLATNINYCKILLGNKKKTQQIVEKNTHIFTYPLHPSRKILKHTQNLRINH